MLGLKNKKGIKFTNAFLMHSTNNALNESGSKPNKIWIEHSSGFYKRSMMLWWHENVTEMYLTHNEGKSVVAERLIRTLKNNI